MAEVQLVLVHGQPFAVASTVNNAIQLETKINKLFVGNPASRADSAVLYNPKHVDAVELLESLGLERAPEENATSTGVKLTLPATPARKRVAAARR